MHEAIRTMLRRYECQTLNDHVNALREILQELALLGLWRGKFFEHAAFYGGTALRVLHGMDRYSEDLDFSLLRPTPDFSLGVYGDALRREIESFGFEVEFGQRPKTRANAIESAFPRRHIAATKFFLSPFVVHSRANFVGKRRRRYRLICRLAALA